jgi:hypothetical protein
MLHFYIYRYYMTDWIFTYNFIHWTKKLHFQIKWLKLTANKALWAFECNIQMTNIFVLVWNIRKWNLRQLFSYLLHYLYGLYLYLMLLHAQACAKDQRLVADFQPQHPSFNPRSGHVGFVNKMALGRFSLSTSFSPASSYTTKCPILIYNPQIIQQANQCVGERPHNGFYF